MTLEEKAGVIRTLFESVSRGDFDAAADCFEPEGELDFSRSRGVMKGVYRRRHALVKFYKEMRETWDTWEADPQDFVDVGEDGLLATVKGHMVGRDGLSLDVQGAGYGTFRNGRLLRWVFFQSREDAEEEVL